MTSVEDDICRKLRYTVREFGQSLVDGAVIIGNVDINEVGGHEFIYAPTVSVMTLGQCKFKVARFFEDA